MAPPCLALPPTAPKWLYLAGFLAQSVAMWLLRDYGARVLRYVGPLAACNKAPGGGAAAEAVVAACVGKGAVLRLGWGGVLFFGAHALLTLGVTRADNPRRFFHSGCPPLQIGAWAALCASAFAIPNHVFVGFGQVRERGRVREEKTDTPARPSLSLITPSHPLSSSFSKAARVLGAIFLVLQIIILLDCIFGLNEWLLDREWGAALVAGSALFHGGALAGLGLLYHLWAPRPTCGLHIFFITWTLVMALAYTALSLTPWRPPAAGLLTAGAVFAYTVYGAWAALSSVPDGTPCAPAGVGGGTPLRVIAFVLTLLALAYTTLSSSTEHSKFATTAAGGTGGDSEAPATADGEDADLPYRPDFFSLVFCTGTAYATMVFIAWDTAGLTNPGEFVVDRGWLSFWVKAVAQWVAAALYAWALVAPALLKSRDFG